MAELAGVMVGNYFLLECLGREGMVETYRARPTTRGGYDVVLRIFRPSFPDPTGFQEHFTTEVEKVWRCRHEHIQPLLEFGAGDGLLYSVTELTEVETLEQFLSRWEQEHHGAPLPLPLVARWMTQVCAALHYAHEQQIVHGNIQLSSILMQSEERVLLTDFSMKHIHQEEDPVVAQVEEGNAAYVAPEQAVGILSPACDVYAVGVLLYRLLTGRLPYDGDSAGEIALKHSNEPIPSLLSYRPDVPEAVELVVRVALAKTPAARFPTIAALADALLAAMRGEKPRMVLTPRRRIQVQARRTPLTWSRVLTLISVLIVLAGLVGTLLFFTAIPFHLGDLPMLPFQALNPGGLHVNAGAGITPTSPSSTSTTSAPSSSSHTRKSPGSAGRSTPSAGMTPTAAPVPTTTVTPTPIVCATGTLFIDGSPYLEPALQQVDHDYAAQCSGLALTLRGDGNRALNFVQRGRIDVAASDLTAQASRNLTDRPVAALLYTLIASPDVPLTGLGSAQIQGIFQGQITNWAQVGGPDEAITVILPPSNAAITAIFRAFVLNSAPVQVSGISLKKDLPNQLAQLVSQTPGAIGYVPLSVASTANVQSLAIDGVSASSPTLLAGSYPFWSVEHFYTQGDGTPQAQAFMQFFTSQQEANTLLQFGVIPLALLSPGILLSHLPGPQF